MHVNSLFLQLLSDNKHIVHTVHCVNCVLNKHLVQPIEIVLLLQSHLKKEIKSQISRAVVHGPLGRQGEQIIQWKL